MTRIEDWRAAWAAAKARRLAEDLRLAQIDRDVDARAAADRAAIVDQVAREACLARHPATLARQRVQAARDELAQVSTLRPRTYDGMSDNAWYAHLDTIALTHADNVALEGTPEWDTAWAEGLGVTW